MNDQPLFEFGPFVPIIRRDNEIIIDPSGIVRNFSQTASDRPFVCEVLPEDSIVEAPSLVTPLLLKKRTIWPPEEIFEISSTVDPTPGDDENKDEASDSSDEIQVVKIVAKNHSSENPRANKSTRDAIEECVRLATVANLGSKKFGNNSAILTLDNYYESSVGKLLLGIGLSQVKEIIAHSNVRKLAAKKKRNREVPDDIEEQLKDANSELAQIRTANKPFKGNKILRCPNCPFTCEFGIVMDGHMDIIHRGPRKKIFCNWCDFETKIMEQMIYHNLIEHKKRCRVEKPLPMYPCPRCSFETKSKRKYETHILRCETDQRHSTVLHPNLELETFGYPGVTSKPITQDDVKAYEQALRQLRLAAYNPHQLKVSGSHQRSAYKVPILVVPRNNTPSTSGASHASANSSLNTTATMSENQSSISGRVLGQSQNNSSQLMQLLAFPYTNSNQITTNLAQYPNRITSSFVNGRSVISSAADLIMGPYQQSCSTSRSINNGARLPKRPRLAGVDSTNTANTASSSKNSSFVICEICDGYIKDLNQLKSHMHWTHKVKIHQKMLESRPPLNCQKCHWRFFTDQGLERHLLGLHGLVTTSMQDQVDTGTDAGRCTICGRAFANKLVAHIKDTHKLNLKPAHLSYKCTVCSATFNLYRLFENHVYSVHSEALERVSINQPN